MGVFKFILHVIGWLLTVVFQIVGSYLIIFLCSVIFAGVDTTSRTGWLFLLFMIWVGYVVGINLIGIIALRWVWQGVPVLAIQRLVGTMIGAILPLLILLFIGYGVPVGDERFIDLVTNTWQPTLAQASLFAAIVGYFVSGMSKRKIRTSTAN
jgi:hypothetical protein